MNKIKTITGNGTESTIKMGVIENEESVQIIMTNELYCLFCDSIAALNDLVGERVGKLQSNMNYAFISVLKASPHYMEDNLNALVFYNELTAAFTKSEEVIHQVEKVLSTNLKKRGKANNGNQTNL